MVFVPGCQVDIFVSYCSENNRDGWVRQFVARLGDELEQLLGRQFSSQSIFYDKTALRAGQDYPQELETAARDSAILIPILSPSYFSSPWCETERLAFLQRMPPGATPADCLAPIRVRAGDDGTHNARIEELVRAQAYSFLADEHHPHSAGSPEWLTHADAFAVQVAAVLRRLRQNHKPIFLGRAPRQFPGLRARVVAHLEESSFRTTSAAADLAKAALAVHFVGGSDDETTDQYRLDQIDASATAGVSTVVYQPMNTQLTAAEDFWKQDTNVPAKWIAGKNEQELLAILTDELMRLAPAPAREQTDLALVCDIPDLPEATRLQREISGQHRLDVRSPDFLRVATPSERLRQWTGLMRQSRGLLFCWGESAQQKLDSLERLASQHNRVAEREWFLLEPGVPDKLTRRPAGVQTLRDLDPFLGKLKGKAAGTAA